MLADEAKARVADPPSTALASPFKRLGLQGLEGIAPVLVAALATEEPLLLIGPHGTAKTLLLTRVAAALGAGVPALQREPAQLRRSRRLSAAGQGRAAWST